jgi:hypothetical protein
VVEAALRHPDPVERLVRMGPTVDPRARAFLVQAVRWLRCVADEHPSMLALLVSDVVDLGLRQGASRVRLMLAYRLGDKLAGVRCGYSCCAGERA